MPRAPARRAAALWPLSSGSAGSARDRSSRHPATLRRRALPASDSNRPRRRAWSLIGQEIGADGGGRTRTPEREGDFKSHASTSFATSALPIRKRAWRRRAVKYRMRTVTSFEASAAFSLPGLEIGYAAWRRPRRLLRCAGCGQCARRGRGSRRRRTRVIPRGLRWRAALKSRRKRSWRSLRCREPRDRDCRLATSRQVRKRIMAPSTSLRPIISGVVFVPDSMFTALVKRIV